MEEVTLEIENFEVNPVKMPVVVENAFTDETCDFLTAFIYQNPNAFLNEDTQLIPQFKNKTISYKLLHRSMPEPFGDVERALNYARFVGQKNIIEHFGEYCYPENTELTRWFPGDSMSVHADNSWPEEAKEQMKDQPHPTAYRDYSGIFYLNDAYGGGEIYFPKLDFEVKPKKGSCVIFPSGIDHEHGVQTVAEHHRYTIAVWYTTRPAWLE
jgi:Rps23 Pro-64 3,4-dihydroxylase Tpa1-like proline 4-hydroxylase